MESVLLHSYKTFSSSIQNGNFTLAQGDSNDPGVATFHSPSHVNSSLKYIKADLIKNVISRIALDGSSVEFKHLKIDDDGNQTEVKSKLIDCLSYKANIDQTGRAFIYDLIWSLIDEGVIAIFPTETTEDIKKSDKTFDIVSMRVGKIEQWYTKSVRINVYNEEIGLMQSVLMDKSKVAIIESPLKEVLERDNQTLHLLKQKIEVLNAQDANASTGRINGFIQFPYQTSTTLRKKQATERRKQIESEMANGKYGLVTLEANEKFISSGGGIPNNVLDDIRKLQQDFYNQIGFTENIINGTASSAEVNLYYHRVIDPILQAIVDAINVSFISKTARSQGQKIMFFRDPFKNLGVESLASTADLFSRNAILTPNEVRNFIGRPPHPSPLANELFNRNIADANQQGGVMSPGQMDGLSGVGLNQNEIYDDGNGGLVDVYGNYI